MINTNSIEQITQLVNDIKNIRLTYLQFGAMMEILENYLKKELISYPEYQITYEDSGEKKDFEQSFDKIEELFKFIITSKETHLQKIINL